MTLVVPVVAFGIWHRYTARHYCLPSLLPQAAETGAQIIVYTDEPREFAGLPLETVRISRARPAVKHLVTTRCYRMALQRGRPIVTVAADMFCAAGLLRAAERLAERYVAVLCPVLRCDELRVKPWLKNEMRPAELFAVAQRALHDRMQFMFWDELRDTVQPTMVLRRARGAITARCFHSHPIVLGAGVQIGETQSIDGQFIGTVATDQIHVVTDSDELMVIDVCDGTYRWDGNRRWSSPERWVQMRTNAVHRWTFRHECVMHADEYDLGATPAGYAELCHRLEGVTEEAVNV